MATGYYILQIAQLMQYDKNLAIVQILFQLF